MTIGRRFSVVALCGGDASRGFSPDERPHGVQAGGCGGRIIGDGWRLNRQQAERLAEELEIAFAEGEDMRVEA